MPIPALISLTVMAVTACTSGGSDTTPTGPTLPTLSIADATVLEGDSGTTSLDFRVTLSGASTSNVGVSWATSDGSATAGSDYTAASGTLTIAPGNTTATISVTTFGDANAEADESLTVTLANATGATIADGSAVGTIQNDDAAAVFGLDVRPDNQTCVAPPRSGAATSVAIQDAFPGLVFNAPTKLRLEPVADPRWFVLQKSGLIRVFDPDNPFAGLTTYVDLSAVVNPSGEGGLFGMAFHPNYPATPEIFLSYTRDTSPMRSVISRVVLNH